MCRGCVRLRFFRPSLALLFLALACVPGASSSAPTFEQVGISGFGFEALFHGTRAEALGSADLAGASGVEAQLLNPAPLALEPAVEVAYGQMEWFDADLRNYGIAGVWRGIRLALVRDESTLENVVIRTAFEPDGETFDIRERIDVVGASWAHRHESDPNTSLLWSVGAGYRRYSTHFASAKASGHTFDAGSTFGVSRSNDGVSATLLGAVAWQNLFDQKAKQGAREITIPRPLRVGLTADLGLDLEGWAQEDLRLRLAYAHTFELQENQRDDDHLGAELTLLSRIAFRLGNDGDRFGEGDSWGVGLVLHERWTGPFTLFLDWTRVGVGEDLADEPFDLLGLRARMDL